MRRRRRRRQCQMTTAIRKRCTFAAAGDKPMRMRQKPQMAARANRRQTSLLQLLPPAANDVNTHIEIARQWPKTHRVDNNNDKLHCRHSLFLPEKRGKQSDLSVCLSAVAAIMKQGPRETMTTTTITIMSSTRPWRQD